MVGLRSILKCIFISFFWQTNKNSLISPKKRREGSASYGTYKILLVLL